MKKALLLLLVFIAIATSFFPELFYDSIIGGFSISHFFMGFFLILFINYNIKNCTFSDWKVINPLMFLCFWGVLSAVWSPFPMIAVVFGVKLLFISNIFITAVILLKKHKLELGDIIKTAQAIVILTIVGQAFGLLLGINVYGAENTSAGLSDNVSAIAGQLLFTTPLILLTKNKLIQNTFLFLIFISILLTLRRSALLSFFLILIFTFLYRFLSQKTSLKVKFNSIISMIGILLIIGFVITSTDIGASFLERASDLDPTQEGTASGRYNFQGDGVVYVLEREFLGTVLGEGMGYSMIVNIKNGYIPIGMHSDFLDILIGLGLLGFTAFLTFYYRIFKLVKKYKPGTPNFNAGIGFLIALASISLFSGGFFNINTIPGYIALAYIFADRKYILKNSNLRKLNVEK